MARTKFARGSGVYECSLCRKRTRDTGQGEVDARLCARCWNRAGLENDHLDDNHEGRIVTDCPICAGHKDLDAAVRAEAAGAEG